MVLLAPTRWREFPPSIYAASALDASEQQPPTLGDTDALCPHPTATRIVIEHAPTWRRRAPPLAFASFVI